MSSFWRWVKRKVQAVADIDEEVMAKRVDRDMHELSSLPGDTFVVKAINNGYLIFNHGDAYRNEGMYRSIRYAATIEAISEEIARMRATDRLINNPHTEVHKHV